jgi:signal transduction histidine kinase/DNA-binding response OmpR family regulator
MKSSPITDYRTTARELSYQRSILRVSFAVTLFAITLPLLTGAALLALSAPLVVTGVASVVVGLAAALFTARRLAPVLTRPADTLMAIAQAGPDGLDNIALVEGSALPLARLRADFDGLEATIGRLLAGNAGAIADLTKIKEHAQAENLAKSQFLANMSHELRTPLNAIMGYAMLLREDATEAHDDGAVQDLGRILQAGRNLLGLVNDILALSKIETGKASIERGVIDVAALVHSVANGTEAEGIRNGNAFTLSIATDVGIMFGDAAKVRQCLTNLLNNAFKFTRDGTVSLDVEIVARQQGSFLSFRVTDTGIGMTAEEMGGLFEAFRQADNSATRQFGGTGLGLAITDRLSKLMGGMVSVESQKGHGSTFTLLLPADRVPVSRQDMAASGPTAPDTEIPVGFERLALVIDDDESAIDLMRRWLSRHGYGVVAAHEGETGLKMLRALRPDIVILDVIMPGRSGYEILEEIRCDPAIAETPVLLITVDDNRVRAFGAGATEMLVKPVLEDKLSEVLSVYGAKADGEVLVVEDDPDAGDLVQRCAEQVGLKVRRAYDGFQGLTMARERRPAAIVLDLAMPGISGFDVIDSLCADDDLSDVPVVVLSAREISLDEHEKIREAGYIFCPKGGASPRELAQSLKEMVAR